MTISLQGARPRSQVTEALPVNIIAEPPIEDSAAKTIQFRVALENLTVADFPLGISTTINTAQITGADFSQLRKGDAIDSTNVSGSVVSINTASTPHTATLDDTATATGAVTATVTPQILDAALFDLVVKSQLPASGSDLRVAVELHQYSGATASNGNGNGKDSVLPGAAPTQSLAFTVNLDQFLSAARLPRS
jgi:hypothetical protein